MISEEIKIELKKLRKKQQKETAKIVKNRKVLAISSVAERRSVKAKVLGSNPRLPAKI